jgi:hypothetical protein
MKKGGSEVLTKKSLPKNPVLPTDWPKSVEAIYPERGLGLRSSEPVRHERKI